MVVDGDTINLIDTNGFKQGYWRVFASEMKMPGFEPTQIVEQGYYIDDIKQGIWEHFNVDNKVEFACYYINGVDTIGDSKNNKLKNIYINNLLNEIVALKSNINRRDSNLSSNNNPIQILRNELAQSKQLINVLIGIICLVIFCVVLMYLYFNKRNKD